MSFYSFNVLRMWKSAILLFVFVGLGFTSKFDLYHDDLFGFDVDDIDASNSNNLFDIDETSTSVDNLQHDKQKQLDVQKQPIGGPDFDYSRFRNLTILVDNTAYLKCYVKNIGNKTVSWVRHRNINLLTVGTTSYTSDSRFQSIHDPDSEEWILKIRYSQVRDSGFYECQISTTPPKGYAIYLTVVEPLTSIIGGPDVYVHSGSTINLTCIVKNSPESPFAMFWTHNNIEINFDSERGGVSVITEKADVTTSYLLIQRARASDSGQYTCSPSNANSKSVNVHILAGSNPEAMHGNANVNLHPNVLHTAVPITLFILIRLIRNIYSSSIS
ncbi:hypothetical protein PVAND_012330 [Polypedilum vanderplanki]|uniref:Ig-like domain-containing protein n=1 Tax=Polypedilum vanderplanki TaxID=319348 RepID=A0A9J6CM54_POLVA|nr:hypothetical protein PVAND_012330 [Polypedilum vanderplanki]